MGLAPTPQQSDIEFASDFLALNTLIEACPNGEKVALLLSTCRNAYLTINAIFVDLQLLLGGEGQSLRGAAELLTRGEVKRAGELLGRATQTLSQADAKKDVWDTRDAVLAQAQSTLLELAKADPLIENRVAAMLDGVRSPDGQLLGGWNHETLAFDMTDRPHLDRYATAIGHVVEVLRGCIALGQLSAVDYSVEAQGSLQLFQSAAANSSPSPELGQLAAALADLCGWNVQSEGDEVLIDNYASRAAPTLSAPMIVRLPPHMSADTAGLARPSVGTMIREAMYRCHDELTNIFKPNVAERPMSDPFVVHLPGEARSATSGVPREVKVERIRCRSGDGPRDHAKLAIANLAVSESDLDDYQIREDVAANVISDVRLAVREAVKAQCQAIVFPEYSIPRSLSEELLKVANDERIVVIGGLEGDWKGNKLVDKALVAIPGEAKLHHQLKQEPSLYEEAPPAFHSDNIIRLFTGTPIGDFAVTVCSDWLETATMRVWRSDKAMPEVHVVVARNGYTELYRGFGVADAMRLYAAVVVANVCEKNMGGGQEKVINNDGSGVFAPLSKQSELKPALVPVDGGVFCTSLSVFDLNLRAIRARSRGKPEPGYFAVPKSAQRTLGEER
jgi:predicted amidohydrolase